MSTPEWWRDAVIYQVYLRSFADSNADGIGDIDGLRRRLDHISALGVDGIWLNPHYASPQRDHGYDISDYQAVEPDFGDLEAFDALVADAHQRGLKVLLDMVANHCSDEHPWFQAALVSAPGSPERARFVFRPGRGPDGSEPPNNWESVFGGPAWTQVPAADGGPGEWYLHIFDASQPDFNWHDPAVLAMFEEVLRFWFDRDVDGFRIDVGHGLFKHPDLGDWPCSEQDHDCEDTPYNGHMWNQEQVHAVYRDWRALADSYSASRELMFVGEVWVPQVHHLADYLRPDELHQAFFFDLLLQPWDGARVRSAIGRGLAQAQDTGTPVTWTLANHDVPRTVTRYGTHRDPDSTLHEGDPIAAARARGEFDLALGTERARAGILMLLALPGAVYLYAGEELGLPEVYDIPDEVREDPIFRRTGGAEVGRDGCRIPLPWSPDGPNLGFQLGDGAAAEPWLPQPDWFAKYAVSVQTDDADSMLTLYVEALHLRRETWRGTDFIWLDAGSETVLAFRRADSVCVVNLGSDRVPLPAEWGVPVLTTRPIRGRILDPNAAAWLVAPTSL